MRRHILSPLSTFLFINVACSGKTAEEEAYDGVAFNTDCAALESLFVTDAVASADDWSGYWQCYQEENGCEGTSCTWDTSEMDAYVLSESCADAGSCTIDGQTVQECRSVESVGSVTFDCGTDGEIGITANGLPGHTIENYAQSGELPPMIGSSASNADYLVSNEPVYNADSELFASGGGTVAFAVNGVSVFNQFTGIGTVAVEDEVVDDCGGHPANSTYHYHAYPVCGELATAERIGTTGTHSGLVGLSLDGFPIFGPYGYSDPSNESSSVVRMESCYALTSCEDVSDASCYAFDDAAYENGSCDLDRCNGRVTAAPASLQAALGSEIYAYYMTLDSGENPAFPYQPYCYRGDAGETASGGPQGGPPN